MKKSSPSLTASVVFAGLFASGAAVAAGAPAVDLEKGQAAFITCAACHGADGGTSLDASYPKLSQQHPAYLIKQLQDFKSGARTGTVMNGMAAPLSDEDMRNIAHWVSTQKMPIGQTPSSSLVLGDKIWRGGIASRNVPACAGCHSPNGAGIPSQYPRLSGQNAAYIEQQLKEFRDGARTNDKVMPGVVNGMTDAQIKAVSEFVQGLH